MKYISRLWTYVRRYRWRLATGLALGILSAALNFASLPVLQKVLDVWVCGKGPAAFQPMAGPGWPGPVRHVAEWILGLSLLQALIVVVAALVLVKFLQGIAKALQEYCTGWVASHSTIDIANDLYRNVIELPIGFFTQARNSQVVSRFTNDMFNIERGLDAIFGKLLVEPLYLVGYLAFCFLISPTLTLISMAVMPFVVAGVWMLSRKSKRGARQALQSRGRLMGLLSEALAAIRIVKVFQGADHEKGRFESENGQLFRQNLKIVKAEATTGPLVEFCLFVAGAAVIVMSGYFIMEKNLKPSEAMVFVAALGLAFDPARKLAGVNTRYQLCTAGAERVFEYMDMEAEKMSAPGAVDVPPVRRSIRFENVGFGYEPNRPVLRDVDFEVKQGEVVAIVGASGAGKTTLVNLITRFYIPSSGRILFDDTDIAGASLLSVRRQIGLVTQEVLLFDDTVRANIAYGVARPDERRVMAAARAAHVEEFVARLSHGYDTVIGEGGATLSGGQRQRLALARAIYKDPAVLILDEATSSLDSESEHLIKQALEEFTRGRTTFVIAHRLATVERADRIIVLDYGRIQAVGTHAELVQKSDIYRGLYQHQFRSVEDDAANNSDK